MKKIVMVVVVICFLHSSSQVWAEDKLSRTLGDVVGAFVQPFTEMMGGSRELEPIVVTPLRAGSSVLAVAKNVSVVDEEEIERSAARSVPDLVKDLPGVSVQDTSGTGKSAQVDIRGYGESAAMNALVMVDGRRTNQVDISGTDWSQIDIDSIERVEVVRGPQTVLYGDNASDGVINIITKTGGGKKPQAGFIYRTGSYDLQSYKGFVEGSTKFLDYYGGYAHSRTTGYRMNSDLETIDLSGNILMRPTDSARIRMSSGYHKDWYGMPGALSGADIERLGRQGTIYPNDRSKTEDAYLSAGPEVLIDSRIGEIALSTDILARGRRTKSIFISAWGITEMTNHIRTLGVTPKATITSEVFGRTNTLVTGVDYYSNKDEILSGDPTVGKDMIVIMKDSTGFYASDIFEVTERVRANCGYRGEWAAYTFDQQAVLRAKNTRGSYEQAWDGGCSYAYNDRSAIYANAARSFRFPAVDEWYSALWSFWGITGGGLNLDLAPQTAMTYEVGIKEHTLNTAQANVSYFVTDTRHELYFNPVTLQNSLYDQTMRHGLEFEGHLFPVGGFDIFGNYTYTKAFFIGGTFAGNEVPMVPRHRFSTGVDYTFMECVNFRYTMRGAGNRRFISDQRNIAPKMKPYMTHDFKVSYYKYGFAVYAALYNIFGAEYSDYGVTNATASALVYYPAPGRNFVAGVTYAF